jgi:integrase
MSTSNEQSPGETGGSPCPFYIHKSGQYAKKIAGKTRYFGHVRDGLQVALDRFARERAYWERGFTPPAGVLSRLTLRQLMDAYLLDYQDRVQRAEVSARSWRDSKRTCQMVLDFLGGDLAAESLSRGDWERLRAHWAGKYAPVVAGNHVRRTRAVLRWSGDPGPLEQAIDPGRGFRPPAARVVRQAKRQKRLGLVDPKAMKSLLARSCPQMKAMILVGANCAFHTCDVGRLQWSEIDLKSGWYRGSREKTGIERKAKLWAETVLALKAIEKQQKKEGSLGKLVFISRLGTPLYDETKQINGVSQRFTRLAKACKVQVAFKDFRSTFQTIADDLPHQLAVKCVMGHAAGDISGVYRQLVSDQNVTVVCGHVRKMLLLSGRVADDNPQIVGEDS